MSAQEIDAMSRRLEQLERANRRWRRVSLAAWIGVVAIAAPGALRLRTAAAQQEERKIEAPGDPAALYEELHRMGHRAIDIVDRTMQMGSTVPDPSGTVALWSLRLLNADLYRSLSKEGPRTTDPEVYLSTAEGPPVAERANAFLEHLRRMKTWEARLRPLSRDGKVSALDFMEIEARRIQAEAWLARELRKPRAE